MSQVVLGKVEKQMEELEYRLWDNRKDGMQMAGTRRTRLMPKPRIHSHALQNIPKCT